MKKQYTKPEVQLVRFEDIITQSGVSFGVYNKDADELDNVEA